MEIHNEITKTTERIDFLNHQNEVFKHLLEKALTLTKKVSKADVFENEFTQESLEIIEKEKENLKCELKALASQPNPDIEILFEKIQNLENISSVQDREIEFLKSEHAEIKFLLIHPEAKENDWLKDILNFQNTTGKEHIVEERFHLQRKILNLERKKAELLIAIKNASIPENLNNVKSEISQFIIPNTDKNLLMRTYEDLRFKMLNLEDERFRLLQELQYILECSRREIAEEYSNLQKNILDAERQRIPIQISCDDVSKQDISQKELENILSSFRNVPVPLTEKEEEARESRVGSELDFMFCPTNWLPMYCTIL